MSQIERSDPSSGGFFSTQKGREVLNEEGGDSTFRDRIRRVTSEDAQKDDEPLRTLLQIGVDGLEVEQVHLARIDVAAGTHAITEVSGPPPAVSRGETRDLSKTYCRRVLAENAVLAVRNAPEDGWREDAAYGEFGFSTYLGTKVVVDGTLYGTLCFVGREAREHPFTEADVAAAKCLARSIGRLLNDRSRTRPSQPTEAWLEALFAQSPNMITSHDEEGTLIVPNPHLCEKTGYTEEELTGMKVWDLDREMTPEEARGLWADMDPGDRASWEGTYQRKDETTFPVEVDLRCIDVDGKRRFIATGRDVTARKTAEQKLREERDLLDRIFETSPAPITVLDTEGEFMEVSDRAEEVLGLEESEVTNRTYNDPAWHIRGPEGGPMPDEELPYARVMATGEPVYDVEHRIAWPDGTHRLLSVSGAPLRAPDGELDGVVFHLDDITEQRASEQALQKERDRFAALFHNLPTPVAYGYIGDENKLRIQAVNERFEAVFGYREDEIRGEDIQDLIVPDEEMDTAEAFQQQFLEGNPVNWEVRRRAADGLRDFRLQTAVEDDAHREEGEVPAGGFAIYTDLTEPKERERSLARRKALLEAQAEATIDGLLVVDEDRRVAFANDRFFELWDLPTTLFENTPPGNLLEQDLLDETTGLLSDPGAVRNEVEYLHNHPDKESRDLIRLTDGRWVDRYSAPIIGDTGEHFGRLWVDRDVTEQRQMMDRIVEVQEEERRRIDQEIHDEMGGLLTSIQFSVGLARRSVQDEDASAEHLDQLQELVDDLAAVSRTISRKLYPSDLSEHGLDKALCLLIEEVKDEQDLEVDFYSEIGAGDRFSFLIERTVYWVVQEVLMSVARQKDVESTQVIVGKREKRLYVHLFDEGAGLASSTPGTDENFPLEAIQRRVEWLEGEMRIDSVPDEGARLSFSLPVKPPVQAY